MNDTYKSRKPRQAFIVGHRDFSNKGDLAILKSEIEILQRDLAFDNVVVSVTYVEPARALEPSLNIQPTLIDARYVSPRGGPILTLLGKLSLVPLWVFQVLLLPLQLLLARAGLVIPYRGETYRSAVRSDAVFYGGGSSLMDVGSKNDSVRLSKLVSRLLSLCGLLWQLLWLRWITGARVISFPQSLGPFHTKIGKWLVRRIVLAMDLLLLREPLSEETARELGVEHRCAPSLDVAFHLSKAKIELKGQRPILGIAPRICPLTDLDKYAEGHARVADWWIDETGGSVVFVPSNELGDGSIDDDVEATNRILGLMKNQSRADYISISKCEIYKGILGSLDILLATRMHPTILAAPSGVPFVAVFYEHKQEGLAKLLDTEDYLVDIADVSLDSVDELIAKVSQAYKNQDGLRKQLLLRTANLHLERDDLICRIESVLDGYPKNLPESGVKND